MPRYNYKCGGCGHEFSAIYSIAERKKACGECENCADGIVGLVLNRAPASVSGVKGPQSAPEGFKDMLREMKKKGGKDCDIDI